MYKFEYMGVIYQAETLETLQTILQDAGLQIDMETLLLNEQQEIVNEVLNEQLEIANEQLDIADQEMQDIVNEELNEIADEEYAKVLEDKEVNNKLN